MLIPIIPWIGKLGEKAREKARAQKRALKITNERLLNVIDDTDIC